jgi:hypothetical protein
VTQVKRVVRVERRTVTVPRAGGAVPAATPQAAGTTTGLGVDTRRPPVRRPARAATPRRSAGIGNGGSGRRSGASAPSATPPADTGPGSPATGTPAGPGERGATTTAMQPKRSSRASL